MNDWALSSAQCSHQQDQPNGTRHELSATLGCGLAAIVGHFRALGHGKGISTPASRELCASQLTTRVSGCQTLFVRQHRRNFLRQLITGAELVAVCFNYSDIVGRTTFKEPKGKLPPKRSTRCVVSGIPKNCTGNCQQLRTP